MGMDKNIMYVISFFLGMLIFHLLKGYCGCNNVVEGQSCETNLSKEDLSDKDITLADIACSTEVDLRSKDACIQRRNSLDGKTTRKYLCQWKNEAGLIMTNIADKLASTPTYKCSDKGAEITSGDDPECACKAGRYLRNPQDPDITTYIPTDYTSWPSADELKNAPYCAKCVAGTWKGEVGNGTCNPCAAMTASNQRGRTTTCDSCADNMVSDAGAEQCHPSGCCPV